MLTHRTRIEHLEARRPGAGPVGEVVVTVARFGADDLGAGGLEGVSVQTAPTGKRTRVVVVEVGDGPGAGEG